MVWNRFHSLIALVYLAGLLLVGILAGRKKRDSNQFLNATGALPLWVCIVACIAANCGSLDVIAMMALGAQYGMLACHFYWIGAVPALVVLAFWLLPAYARGRYPTVLDFIGLHYGPRTRSMAALCMAATMLLLAGVCLCAVVQIVVTFLGWNFYHGVLVTAPVVLFYTWVGGLRATVYTELLHFALVIAAVVPLVFLVARDFGGVAHLLSSIPANRFHAWQTLPVFDPQATMDRFGLILGLGVVLSFGFWSTDFVQMQRTLAVRKANDVVYVPLSMAAAKPVFALLIVLPGVAAPLALGEQHMGTWNATLPAMMLHYYSHSWVAIGVMGLFAGLISTFANNVSGFSSAWVQGIYQPWIRPTAVEEHYVWIGRLTNAAAILLSIGAASLALRHESLMEYVQMILSTFNAPLFALVALAALAPRRAAKGGLGGFALGLICACIHQALVHAGVLHYGSQMSANFYAAILGFAVAACSTLLIGLIRGTAERLPSPDGNAGRTLVHFSLPGVLLAGAVIAACLLINVLFW
jgi:solute:Na+ symporter, SSS family